MAVQAVYSAAGKVYAIDDNDALWLARMVIGEGGYRADTEKIRALLWAILNRFLLLPAQRERTSLVELLQAFSQPINPRWDGQGERDFCGPGGKYEGTAFCAPERIRRRAQMSSIPWAKVPPKIKNEIEKLRKGDLPYPKAMAILKANGNPFRINNWASYPSVRNKFPWGIDVGGDWFFEDRGTLQKEIFIDGFVKRLEGAGFAAINLLAGMTLGAGIGGAAWWLLKRFG